MIEFGNIHPLIFDVSLIAIFVLIIFFGAVKGIKNVLVDFLLLLSAFVLSFSQLMNSVKEIFAKELFKVDEIVPAGSNSLYKFGVATLINLASAALLFIMFYLVFQAIRSAIKLISKAQPKQKSKVGRFFGALVSLIYQGGMLIFLLVIADNNFVGLSQTFDKSTVANFVTNSTEKLIEKVDKNLDEKLTIKVLKGDIFYEVSEDAVVGFNHVEENVTNMFISKNYVEILNDGNVTDEDMQMYIKDRILDLHKIALFTANVDQFGVCKERFSLMAEDLLIAMHRTVLSRGINKIEFTMTDLGNIKNQLEKAGMNEKSAAFYDEITLGK